VRIFDSHIHADALTERVPPPGGHEYRALVPGITPSSTAEAIESAFDYDWFGAALHPWYLDQGTHVADIEELLGHPSVCAVGETGLDHLRHESDEARHIAECWFADHVRLALEHDLPIVIHCVRAHDRCLSILADVAAGRARGVVHAYSGSVELADRYWREGFYVGIGAAVTRERSKRVRRAAATIPLDRILVETDAPFLAAADRSRGEGASADILQVIDAVAELHSVSSAEVAECTFVSAFKLFSTTEPS
jgi:TatD DNase family protein